MSYRVGTIDGLEPFDADGGLSLESWPAVPLPSLVPEASPPCEGWTTTALAAAGVGGFVLGFALAFAFRR